MARAAVLAGNAASDQAPAFASAASCAYITAHTAALPAP